MKPPRKDHLINRALEDQRKRRDVEAPLAGTKAGQGLSPKGDSDRVELPGAPRPAASTILPTEHPDGCDCTRCEDSRRVAIGLHPKDEDVYPWELRKRRRSLFAEVRRTR